MPIPQLRSKTENNVTSNSTTKVVTAPSGIVDDDILLICIALDGTSHAPTSSGFTALTSVEEGSVGLYYLWKRAASESGDYTVNWTGSDQGRFIVLAISGCITGGSPIDVEGAGSTGNASSASATGITSTVAESLGVVSFAVDRDRVTTGASTNISGGAWIDLVPHDSSGGAGGAGMLQGIFPSATAEIFPTATGNWGATSDGYATSILNFTGLAGTPIDAKSRGLIVG